MDTKINYILKDINNGIVETEETLVNKFSADLKIHNSILSASLKKPSFFDENKSQLKHQSVPIRNGEDYNFAVFLDSPVPHGRDFTILTRAELDKSFLSEHIKEENGIYFWKHFFVPGKKTFLLYSIALAGNMKIIHAEGISPSFIRKNEITWELSMEQTDCFQTLLMFKIQ